MQTTMPPLRTEISMCVYNEPEIPATQTTAPKDIDVLQLLLCESVLVVHVASQVCYFSEQGIYC
jgi:hypothetical protein